MSKKFTSTVFGASLLLMSVGILTKGFGFFREMIYANNFGLSLEFNIYLVSVALPLIINTTFIYLGQNYFVPSYNKVISENQDDGKKFLSYSFWLFFLFGFVVFVVFYILSDFIIDYYLIGSAADAKLLAINIFRIYIITIPLNAGQSIISAYFQTQFTFTYPAFSQFLVNIIVVLFLIFLSSYWDIYVIPIAFVVGICFQLVYLLWFVRRKISFNPFLLLEFDTISKYTNTAIIFTVAAEIVTLSYIIIDRYFLNQVEEGGIAALNYANTLFALPISIFSLALSTAIFPKLSQSFNQGKKIELEKVYQKGININIFLFTPIAIIFFMFSDQLIGFVFERGKFGSYDTIITSNVLKIYTISLIFYSSYAIINKMIYSARLLKQLLFLCVLGFILKSALNFGLVKGYGHYGLAISSTVSYIFLCIGGYIIIYLNLKFHNGSYLFKQLSLHLLNSLLSFTIVSLTMIPLSLNGFTKFFLEIFLFLSLYFANNIFFKSNEIALVRDLLKSSFPKRTSK